MSRFVWRIRPMRRRKKIDVLLPVVYNELMNSEFEALPIVRYRLTAHALLEMERRRITEAEVADVLALPEQTELVRSGRIVCQSRVQLEGRMYLLRVFVDVDREPPEIVTVYRTSKIEKYWRYDR